MRLKSAVNQQEKEAGCFPIFLKAIIMELRKPFGMMSKKIRSKLSRAYPTDAKK